MKLSCIYDSVIMLTASNWFTEPRSNRYHYATRFARELPVYFVQFDHGDKGEIRTSPTEFDNLTVVHLDWSYVPYGTMDDLDPAEFEPALKMFRRLNCKRPLVWIYNPYAEQLARAIPSRTYAYHATENYLFENDGFRIGTQEEEAQRVLAHRTKNILRHADLTIAVSDGVREALQSADVAPNPIFEVINGCDAKFWLESGTMELAEAAREEKRIFFQGGINRRLDFELIHEVVLRMPDWDFWFVGGEDDTIEAWKMLKKHPNVYYKGKTDPQGIADLAAQCHVGWVPFIDTPVLRTSLPLKMYEYVACGLPVVSTPINALLNEPEEIFRFAETAEAFELNIRDAVKTRTIQTCLDLRRQEALLNDYDRRFEKSKSHIVSRVGRKSRKKNVLVIYDEKYQYVKTIYEHLSAFKKYSRNNLFFVPGVVEGGSLNGDYLRDDRFEAMSANPVWDFDLFDCIVIHYSARLSLQGYLSDEIVERVAESKAHKVLFIQDEYENTNTAKTYIKKMGIDTIFTCVPPEGQQKVYPSSELPGLKFVQTLTGYVPEDDSIEIAAMPLESRKTMIGYRGRKLPHHYGHLGHDKYRIGEVMQAECEKRNIPANISNRPEDRIYTSWYEFIGSCRATLGSESGANIFDFDGSLQKLAYRFEEKDFEDVYEKHFKAHDDFVRMNQISPKFFESIRLRTALICFRGYYSDILHADVHYIPLEKDFSNLDEVFERLQDDDYIREMTDRAYQDIIESGRYSYETFISEFDAWLDETIPFSVTEIINAPIAVREGARIRPLLSSDQRDRVLNSTILSDEWLRRDFMELFPPQPELSPAALAEATGAMKAVSPYVVTAYAAPASAAHPYRRNKAAAAGAHIKRILPRSLKSYSKTKLQRLKVLRQAGRTPWYLTPLIFLWKLLPKGFRKAVHRRL